MLICWKAELQRRCDLSKIARYSPAAVVLAAISMFAGCGGPSWKQFDDIQVGQPLAATLPGQLHRTTLGAGYIGSHSGSESFWGSSARVVSVLADRDDRVTARACLTVSVAHRLLYAQASYRYVIEADPAFRPGRDAGGDAEALKLVASASQRVVGKPAGVSSLSDRESVAAIARNEVDRCISLMSAAVSETRDGFGGSEMGMAEFKRPAGASMKFSTGLNQSLAVSMAAREIQDRLAGLPASSGGGRPKPFTPSSVSEAMLYNHIMLNTLARPSSPQDAKGAANALAMYRMYAHEDVLELLADPKTYPASLAVGSEKTFRTLGGVSVRLTVPAAGRLKLEISGSVVREPSMTESDMRS
jgi:hypothetical protein